MIMAIQRQDSLPYKGRKAVPDADVSETAFALHVHDFIMFPIKLRRAVFAMLHQGVGSQLRATDCGQRALHPPSKVQGSGSALSVGSGGHNEAGSDTLR